MLTVYEQILIIAIWRLEKDAYGVKIRQYIFDKTQKKYTYGTLYSSLDQLVRKKYVIKTIGDPTPERGGRSKIFYNVTQEGFAALKASRELQATIWDGVSDLAIEKELST